MMNRLARGIAALALASATTLTQAPTASADTITILASEDVSPYSLFPTLIRFINPRVYAVRSDDLSSQLETFLWFDVSLADLPPGHVLTGAQLLVTWSFDDGGNPEPGEPSTEAPDLNCHQVTEDWDQTTLTWLNKPDFDPAFDVNTEIPGLGSIFCDAWPVVFDWIHGMDPNYGIALTNDVSRNLGMHSLEAAASVPDALKANLILTTELPEPGLGVGLAIGTMGLAGARRRTRR